MPSGRKYVRLLSHQVLLRNCPRAWGVRFRIRRQLDKRHSNSCACGSLDVWLPRRSQWWLPTHYYRYFCANCSPRPRPPPPHGVSQTGGGGGGGSRRKGAIIFPVSCRVVSPLPPHPPTSSLSLSLTILISLRCTHDYVAKIHIRIIIIFFLAMPCISNYSPFWENGARTLDSSFMFLRSIRGGRQRVTDYVTVMPLTSFHLVL